MSPLGTYRLRVTASRVGYVPDAQGGLPPGPHVLYVRGTRTSLGRIIRTAYRGTPGRQLMVQTGALVLPCCLLPHLAGSYIASLALAS